MPERAAWEGGACRALLCECMLGLRVCAAPRHLAIMGVCGRAGGCAALSALPSALQSLIGQLLSGCSSSAAGRRWVLPVGGQPRRGVSPPVLHVRHLRHLTGLSRRRGRRLLSPPTPAFRQRVCLESCYCAHGARSPVAACACARVLWGLHAASPPVSPVSVHLACACTPRSRAGLKPGSPLPPCVVGQMCDRRR
jgi:hypothetical protein